MGGDEELEVGVAEELGVGMVALGCKDDPMKVQSTID